MRERRRCLCRMPPPPGRRRTPTPSVDNAQHAANVLKSSHPEMEEAVARGEGREVIETSNIILSNTDAVSPDEFAAEMGRRLMERPRPVPPGPRGRARSTR